MTKPAATFVATLATCVVLSASAALQERTQPTLADFSRRASRSVSATSRVPLPVLAADQLRDLASLEVSGSGLVPNYLKALTLIPSSVRPYANSFKTFLYGGTIEPETKVAMALQIGRELGSPYAVAHMVRILNASESGKALLRHFEANAAVRPEQDVAIRYAQSLTRDVHGIDDGRFREMRQYYNDAQIVELTFTVSFFNYFTRLSQAVNLPVEEWALNTIPKPPSVARDRSPARVHLISNAEMEWAAATLARRPAASQGTLGIDLVNSQRAMNLVPDIASAWRAFTSTLGTDAVVSREILLQVSFAVSSANGCRYCTLHQVLGLRRLGVSIDKLLQMQKDDSALTPRELTAVAFARKLTTAPASVSDEDYRKLRSEFGEKGALEVVLQTCNFAFMNRFTDNLGLPSEDEAVKVYREVYGSDWKKK
jgi:alkylhydroperoxidase family enzyme